MFARPLTFDSIGFIRQVDLLLIHINYVYFNISRNLITLDNFSNFRYNYVNKTNEISSALSADFRN